ncbi:hypothetical protein [Micromonospora sp. NPDC007230]|uniref:hypothetical protein n=1 Tax=Micromonospora sp. NPDC007230 TaxID=3364237 RepID=UPI0036B980DD
MRRSIRVTAALIALLLTPACDSRGDSSAAKMTGENSPSLAPLAGGEPPLDPAIVAAADPRKVAAPIAAYVQEDGRARLVSRARMLVGDRCMREFGFAPEPGWKPEGAVPRDIAARYGLWDEGRAAEFGYLPAEVNDGNPGPVRFVGADATNVYFGQIDNYQGKPVPSGGCTNVEFEAVFGPKDSLDVDGHLQVKLDQEAITRATQDSRVTPLLSAWQACVKSAGWDYKNPQDPFNYWSSRRGSDKTRAVVSDEEKRSALADIGCKKSTGLLGTWLAADIAYQKVLVERNAEQLRAYTKALDTVSQRANKIIAEG